MVVDNCPAANTQLAVGENAMECVDSVSGTMLTTAVEGSTSNNLGICSATQPPEHSEQFLDPLLQNNNKTTTFLTGVKRSPKTDIKEPSPKRSKSIIISFFKGLLLNKKFSFFLQSNKRRMFQKILQKQKRTTKSYYAMLIVVQ